MFTTFEMNGALFSCVQKFCLYCVDQNVVFIGKLGVQISEVVWHMCLYAIGFCPFQNLIRFTYRQSTHMLGNRVNLNSI